MYKTWRRLEERESVKRERERDRFAMGPVHITCAAHILETNVAYRRSHITDWIKRPLIRLF
jgi:hypothetical protein